VGVQEEKCRGAGRNCLCPQVIGSPCRENNQLGPGRGPGSYFWVEKLGLVIFHTK